jgi:hypothetical protein
MLSAAAYNLPPAGAVIPATEARPDEFTSVPDCVIVEPDSVNAIIFSYEYEINISTPVV